MASRELLAPDDSLLPRVLAKASTHEEAFRWVMDSAKAWARQEFVAREMRRHDGEKLIYDMDVRLGELRACKVAVRVNEQHWEADHDSPARFKPIVQRSGEGGGKFRRPTSLMVAKHRIELGLLDGDSTEGYVKLNQGFGGYFSGMMDIADIVPLPDCYDVRPWPVAAGYKADAVKERAKRKPVFMPADVVNFEVGAVTYQGVVQSANAVGYVHVKVMAVLAAGAHVSVVSAVGQTLALPAADLRPA